MLVFFSPHFFICQIHFFRHSTYQRMSLQLNESYGLQLRDRSLPAMPLPDLTTLPHEPIHQLTGKQAPYNMCVCSHVYHSALSFYINKESHTKRLIHLISWLNALSLETGASVVKLHFVKKDRKKNHTGTRWGVCMLTPFFYLSDMRNGHGAWNILTASSLTRRELCHHPWGPVNAAVLRAWRHGPGALHTVVTLTPIGRAYSTETPSTRWETLRTVTGGKQA